MCGKWQNGPLCYAQEVTCVSEVSKKALISLNIGSFGHSSHTHVILVLLLSIKSTTLKLYNKVMTFAFLGKKNCNPEFAPQRKILIRI